MQRCAARSPRSSRTASWSLRTAYISLIHQTTHRSRELNPEPDGRDRDVSSAGTLVLRSADVPAVAAALEPCLATTVQARRHDALRRTQSLRDRGCLRPRMVREIGRDRVRRETRALHRHRLPRRPRQRALRRQQPPALPQQLLIPSETPINVRELLIDPRNDATRTLAALSHARPPNPPQAPPASFRCTSCRHST